MEVLEQGYLSPLTLISAPAGYGKSIMASQWLEISQSPGGWVSLDDNDNDMRLFMSYVLEAIQAVFPDHPLKTRSFLESANLPSSKVIAGYLLNDLETLPERFILIFDDYHKIHNTKIHELLSELLAYPSPYLHIVLVTRRDPPLALTALRSRGILSEVSMRDLRFSVRETKTFLDRFLRMDINRKTAQVLEEKMEGWVTGLHLAALSIRNETDQERLISGIESTPQFVRDYLVQEVLENIPRHYEQLLLRTSILDRFCASICTELSRWRLDKSQTDTELNGEDFIRWLLKRNLFVISLDAAHRWFRYHHLFQELLQNQLRKRCRSQEIQALHLHVSKWFEKEELFDESIHYALTVDDLQQASKIVQQNWRNMMNSGRWHVVAGWLTKLPDDVVQENAQLLLARAWKHYYYLDIAAVSPVMDRIEALTGNGPKQEDLSAEIAMFRGYVDYFENNGASSLNHIEYALDHIAKTDVEFRSQSEILFGLAGHMEGQLERVSEKVNAWLESPSPINPLRKSCLLWTLLFTHYMAGDLQMVARQIQRLKKAATSGGIDNFIAWADYLDGLVKLQQGNPEAAIGPLEKATQRKYQHFTRAAVDAMGALSVAYQANGQPNRAEATLQSLTEFCTFLGTPFENMADACAAMIAVMAGRPEHAYEWVQRTPPFGAAGMMSWFIQPSVIRSWVLIETGSKASVEEAENKLQELAEMNESHNNTCQLVSILNLLAVAYEKHGNTEGALDALDRSVALAKTGKYRFPFSLFGSPMVNLLNRMNANGESDSSLESILASCIGDANQAPEIETENPVAASPTPVHPPTFSHPLVEPLTNRELDILELLAQRLQNKEIADRLCISPQTVKGQLKNIYQKLDTRNRRTAIEDAKRLGII